MSVYGGASNKTNYDDQSMEIDEYDSVLKFDETLAVFKNTFVQNDLSTLGPNETLTNQPSAEVITTDEDDDSRSNHHMYETFSVTAGNQTADLTNDFKSGQIAGVNSAKAANATINMTYDKIASNTTQDLSKCMMAGDDASNTSRKMNTTVTLTAAAAGVGLPSMSIYWLNEPTMNGDETTNVSLVDNETFEFKSKQLNRAAEANKLVREFFFEDYLTRLNF